MEEKERKTGRPRYNGKKLLKVILFAFMEEGYEATRKIEKLCRTDIRFLRLLDGEEAPSHMTICNFINHQLKGKIGEIFLEINQYIFEKVSGLLEEMNRSGLELQGIRFGTREEYAVEYLEYVLAEYARLMELQPDQAIRGRGHRRSPALRLYDKLLEYVKRLKCYAKHIEICGEKRNSYSKTD